MSLSKRDSPFANSGLVVTVPVEEFGGTDVLAGVRLQEKYEAKAFELGGRGEYRSPAQRADDFVAGAAIRQRCRRAATRAASTPATCAKCCRRSSPRRSRTGCRRWTAAGTGGSCRRGAGRPGSARQFAGAHRPRRRARRESPGVPGLYPVGEGAGYAGGIVSAAVDGLRTARAIVGKVRHHLTEILLRFFSHPSCRSGNLSRHSFSLPESLP